MGPGRYRAFMAIRSSKQVGCSSIRERCMPADSNWNVPVVMPLQYSSNVLGSSIGIFSMSMSMPWFSLMLARASLMMERFFSPRKSILISPVSSMTPPSYWVTMIFSPSLSVAVLTGTQSVMSSRPMITPQACTPVLRTLPSSFSAKRMVSPTLGSSLSSSWRNSGKHSRQFLTVILYFLPGSFSGISLGDDGMNLARRLLSSIVRSSTRATSLMALLAAMVP